MKLEEIYKRIKYKTKVEEVEDDSEFFYGDVEKDWEWKPKRYEGDCETPNFEIKIPNSRNGLYTTKYPFSLIFRQKSTSLNATAKVSFIQSTSSYIDLGVIIQAAVTALKFSIIDSFAKYP